jgi:hypothetical protein
MVNGGRAAPSPPSELSQDGQPLENTREMLEARLCILRRCLDDEAELLIWSSEKRSARDLRPRGILLRRGEGLEGCWWINEKLGRGRKEDGNLGDVDVERWRVNLEELGREGRLFNI